MDTPTMPSTYGAEKQAFEHAQGRVLSSFGVAASSRYVQLQAPPLRAHVLQAGAGEPVVLLHGGNAVAVQLAPVMAALQGTFQVFAPDRPGCGLTDRFDYRGVSLREHAVHFVTSVLDALDLPRAALVGNSIGGYWALVFALAYPERVTRLVLAGEPAGSAPLQVTPPTRPTNSEPTLDSIRAYYVERLVAHSERVSTEILDANRAAAVLPGAAQAWNTMLESIRHERLGLTYALRSELAQLRPPTLFLWGDRDAFGPPQLGMEMAALAPHARCLMVHDAGHLPFWDQPEQCAREMREFLAGAR